MRLAILAQPDSWYYRDLDRAARDRGHVCTRLEYSEMQGGVIRQLEQISGTLGSVLETGSLDAVIVRTMPPASLEQVVLRMDLLARWQSAGIRVINSPKALECAIDKYLTTARLAAAGLPVPDTVACETADTALDAFHRLGGDIVVKPLFGGEGRGIVRVSDVEIAQRVFRTLERMQAVLYVQQYIDHGGSDIRVLVLDGRILGGMQRFARDGFRTNVSQSGQAAAHLPTDTESELALRAAQTTGAVLAGIDILYDGNRQPYVIEVNAIPGWKAFARVNQMDVADVFLRWCEAG